MSIRYFSIKQSILLYIFNIALVCSSLAQVPTSVDQVVYDLMGEPFRTMGPYGAPWGKHEAYLEGVPTSYDWYGGAKPGQWMNRSQYGAIAVWGTAFEMEGGSPEKNYRVQVRNLSIYYYQDGEWVLLEATPDNIGSAYYLTNFLSGTASGDKRSEINNGGGISATMIDGHVFHWWGDSWPRSPMPKEAEAIFGIAEARLIHGTDPDVNLRNVRVLVGTGMDYYTTVDYSAGPNEAITGAGIPRHKFLTPEWKPFSMYLVGNTSPESIEEYRNMILSRPLPPGVTEKSITLISPVDDTSFVTPAEIYLEARANAGDASVLKILFYNGTELIGETIDTPYSCTWSYVETGNYELSASLISSDHDTICSPSVPITVIKKDF